MKTQIKSKNLRRPPPKVRMAAMVWREKWNLIRYQHAGNAGHVLLIKPSKFQKITRVQPSAMKSTKDQTFDFGNTQNTEQLQLQPILGSEPTGLQKYVTLSKIPVTGCRTAGLVYCHATFQNKNKKVFKERFFKKIYKF